MIPRAKSTYYRERHLQRPGEEGTDYLEGKKSAQIKKGSLCD